MARSAEDLALMLQPVADLSEKLPMRKPWVGRDLIAAVVSPEADLRGQRFAFCADPVAIGIDAEVLRVCREAAFALREAGAEVLDAGPAAPPARVPRKDGRQPRRQHQTRARNRNPRQSRAGAHPAVERAFFQKWDLLLCPTLAVPPFPVEENYPANVGGKKMATYIDWVATTFVLSLPGLPAGSVPAGLDNRGLPCGLQVLGPAFGEERVLQAEHLVQKLRPLGWPPGIE